MSNSNRLPTPFQRQQHPSITARVQGAPYGPPAAPPFQQQLPPNHGLSIAIPAPAATTSNGPAAAAPPPRRVASETSVGDPPAPSGMRGGGPCGGPRGGASADATPSHYSPYGKSSGIGQVILPNHHPHQLPRSYHSSTEAILVGYGDRGGGLDRVREEEQFGASGSGLDGSGGPAGGGSGGVSGGRVSGGGDEQRCERSTASGVSWSIKPV